MSIIHLAWRNVWRNRRRTLVTIGAMTLALWVMILYSGLVEGYLLGLRRNILDLELGDVQVHAVEYRKNPSLHARIEDPEKLMGDLDAHGFKSSARLLGGGLAAAGEFSAAVTFRGIDVDRDAKVTKVHNHVDKGEWLDAKDRDGVVIGRRLARILAVSVGDELVVVTQGADGSMANELYRVRGILKGITDVVDRSGVYLHAELLRELLVVPSGAHQIIVRHPEDVTLDAAVADVAALAPDLETKSWRKLVPTLASMLDATRGAMMTMFVIVYIAIGIVILNAMLMAVFERIREFGVLKALGMGPLRVFRIIMVESAIQTGIALLAGLALSVPTLWYFSTTGLDLSAFGDMSLAGVVWDPIWRAELNENTFVGPVVILVVVVGLAVLYPAIKAATIKPVEAMRYR